MNISCARSGILTSARLKVCKNGINRNTAFNWCSFHSLRVHHESDALNERHGEASNVLSSSLESERKVLKRATDRGRKPVSRRIAKHPEHASKSDFSESMPQAKDELKDAKVRRTVFPKHFLREHNSNSISPERILRLRNLNMNLTPEDFLRVRPEGDVSYEKVIPLRDPQSLERTGDYIVIFKTASDLRQWRGYLMKCHYHQHHSPEIAEEAAELKNNVLNPSKTSSTAKISLLPAETELQSTVWTELPAGLMRIANQGGYDLIVNLYGETTAKVLVRIEGVNVEQQDMVQALLSDSIRRDSAWDIDLSKRGDGSYGIQNISALVRDPESIYPYGQRWIIDFRTEEPARQFARAWHGLAFAFPTQKAYNWQLSEQAHLAMEKKYVTKVFTEVLW